MPQPHEKSIESALEALEELEKLFDKLLISNSEVHKAYRTIFRALKGNVANVQIVTEALETLRNSVEKLIKGYYDEAVGIGMDQAVRDLNIYDLGEPDQLEEGITVPAIASTLSLLGLQIERVTAISKLELDEELVIGDEDRQGALAPSAITNEARFWITTLFGLAYLNGIGKKMGSDAVKQAVAQIDSNTTRTCLNVHGQIVDLEGTFTLTGTPRFAGKMSSSPFHRGCRTVQAVIMKKYLNDEVTEEMRQDAIEQGKKPKPSSRKGKAHYRVIGKKVQEFRNGRWHKYETHDTNVEARESAAKLNKEGRS